MKTLILIVSLLLSSLSIYSYSSETINMNKLLEENLKFNNKRLDIKKDQPEFVKISFKINQEGNLEVLAMNYSNAIIKDQLIAQLTSLKINGSLDNNKIYYYNFTFVKK